MHNFLKDSGQVHIKIIADGHVNTKTIPNMYKNGAREFVLGKSGLFKGNISKNFEEVVALINTLETQ